MFPSPLTICFIYAIRGDSSGYLPMLGQDLKPYLILNAIRTFYTYLWLEKNGYRQKLAVKFDETFDIDDFGDVNSSKWKNILRQFLESRIGTLDSYIQQSVPQYFRDYANSVELPYLLGAFISDPIYSRKDAIEELILEIDSFVLEVAKLQQDAARKNLPCNHKDSLEFIIKHFQKGSWVCVKSDDAGLEGVVCWFEVGRETVLVYFDPAIGKLTPNDVDVTVDYTLELEATLVAMVVPIDIDERMDRYAQKKNVFLLDLGDIEGFIKTCEELENL